MQMIDRTLAPISLAARALFSLLLYLMWLCWRSWGLRSVVLVEEALYFVLGVVLVHEALQLLHLQLQLYNLILVF